MRGQNFGGRQLADPGSTDVQGMPATAPPKETKTRRSQLDGRRHPPEGVLPSERKVITSQRGAVARQKGAITSQRGANISQSQALTLHTEIL